MFAPEAGAAASRLAALTRALADRGAEVLVLTSRPPSGTSGTFSLPGVRVRRALVLRDAEGSVRGYLPFASFDGPLLLRLLLSRRPDVVVVEPPPTTGLAVRLACSLRRVPYVYYAADVSSTAAAGIGVAAGVVAVLRRLESWVLRGAATVLAVSDGVADEVVRLGVPADRVTVVGTGVDTSTFRPVPTDRRPTAPDRAAVPLLLYAGTMSEIQGAQVFVRAFALVAAEHPHAELVMLGQGTERRELVELAERTCPGRVRFGGVVSPDEVARLMSRAWAGLASVRPARGYDMAYPTKMFVATACGTPVVYAGVGPGRAVLERSELGWSCDWDVEAVAAGLRAALATEPTAADRCRLREWTLQHASQHTKAAAAADRVLAADRRTAPARSAAGD